MCDHQLIIVMKISLPQTKANEVTQRIYNTFWKAGVGNLERTTCEKRP